MKNTLETETFRKLNNSLAKIGFQIQMDYSLKRGIRIDYYAHKWVNGNKYKIAIEFKPSLNDISSAIQQLNYYNKKDEFNKLLIILNSRKITKKNDSSQKKHLNESLPSLEVIDLNDIDRWSEKLAKELTDNNNEVFTIIKEFSKKFIKLIAKNPENLRNLEWRDLERTIAELFDSIGFKTTLTPCSKDGGKDVILECHIDNIKKTFIIEIKHWRSEQKVGQKAVKEFTNVIINEKHERGLFLSTYGFTNNYYENLTEKQRSIVRFGEKEKIIELCQTYEKVNSGIWNPIDTIEDTLFKNTHAFK